MNKKKALVLGATGQDGSYMVELLIDKKYEVHGVYRKSSVGNTQNIEHLFTNKNFFLHKGDLLDPISLNNIIKIEVIVIANNHPPIIPDQVFFGLIIGQSFGPPTVRPTK